MQRIHACTPATAAKLLKLQPHRRTAPEAPPPIRGNGKFLQAAEGHYHTPAQRCAQTLEQASASSDDAMQPHAPQQLTPRVPKCQARSLPPFDSSRPPHNLAQPEQCSPLPWPGPWCGVPPCGKRPSGPHSGGGAPRGSPGRQGRHQQSLAAAQERMPALLPEEQGSWRAPAAAAEVVVPTPVPPAAQAPAAAGA